MDYYIFIILSLLWLLLTFNLNHFKVFERREFIFKAIAYKEYVLYCLFMYIEKDCVQYLQKKKKKKVKNCAGADTL